MKFPKLPLPKFFFDKVGDQQYIYFFIFLIVSGFAGWYYMQSSFDIHRLSPQAIAYLPDIIVDDLTLTQFDTNGQPAHSFYTPELIHFPYKSMSKFQTPNITLTPAGQEPWKINAEKGTAEDGINKIILIGNVVFHQNAAGNQKEKNIKTAEMTYYTKKNWASTSEKIFFEQPGLSVQSIGMTADLTKQKIYLLHQVSSIYDANNNNQTF